MEASGWLRAHYASVIAPISWNQYVIIGGDPKEYGESDSMADRVNMNNISIV